MIGIISAMPEEMDALLNELKNSSVQEKGMRTYYIGALFGTDVVLVFSRWGKVAAAATSTQLINDFNPTEIIFTGVAGGITKTINIGDIVIGNELYQHDLDAQPFYKQFEVPILKKLSFKTVNNTELISAAEKFLDNYHLFIEPPIAKEFDISNPKTIYGDIASGDQFISNLEKINELNKLLPTVTCVEMEGASVAQVCYEYDVPFSIIRIISDKANDNAHIDFAKFMKDIASKYALGILKNYFA